MNAATRILYCHCKYAKVVPVETKKAVLARLCESGVAFDAVADLCEMSARKDRALERHATAPTRIAACFPRAVKWLFHAAGTPLPEEGIEIANMRTESPEEVMELLEGRRGTAVPSGTEIAEDAEDAGSDVPAPVAEQENRG